VFIVLLFVSGITFPKNIVGLCESLRFILLRSLREYFLHTDLFLQSCSINQLSHNFFFFPSHLD